MCWSRRVRDYRFWVFFPLFIGSFIIPLDAANDCCCWNSDAFIIMGYEAFVCWDEGMPDPECGWCTLAFEGTVYTFNCRQDEECEEYEVGCWGLVLIREVTYSDTYDCEYCFCDPPPYIPISGKTYAVCNEDNCKTVSANCDCD